jgi:hypothetical protein
MQVPDCFEASHRHCIATPATSLHEVTHQDPAAGSLQCAKDGRSRTANLKTHPADAAMTHETNDRGGTTDTPASYGGADTHHASTPCRGVPRHTSILAKAPGCQLLCSHGVTMHLCPSQPVTNTLKRHLAITHTMAPRCQPYPRNRTWTTGSVRPIPQGTGMGRKCPQKPAGICSLQAGKKASAAGICENSISNSRKQ